VREGDPDKAVTAIERVLSRDKTRHATQGTMSGFESIARLAATTVGGPAAETVTAGLMSIAQLTSSRLSASRKSSSTIPASKSKTCRR
jgi:hypothetical protein